MRTLRRCKGRRRFTGAVAVLALAVPLSGCDSGDPLALLLTDETRASILVEQELPHLPLVAQQLELEGALGEALTLWQQSSHEDGVGRWALRHAAYDAAVPVLAAESEGTQWELVRRSRDAGLALEPLSEAELPQEIRQELILALERGREADRAWEDDDRILALHLALEAADRIRDLTPPVVADRMVRRAEARWAMAFEPSEGPDLLGVVQGDGATLPLPTGPVEAGSSSSVDVYDGSSSGIRSSVVRGERLLIGARDALDREDYLRAIRRAHYAYQLLQDVSHAP